MNFRRIALGLLVMVIVASRGLAAQERRQGGPTPYDVAKEQTFAAKVVSLERFDPAGNGDPMVYLSVTVGTEKYNVFLAPESWMKKQSLAFKAGDAIEIHGVTGYRLNGDAIMPRTVKAGAKTLTLRDEQGKALWQN